MKMIFRTPLHTARLVLQPESLRDFPRFYSMSVDPEVMKYIGDGTIFHWTEETALAKFRERIAARQNQPFGNLAVYRKDTGQYVGWCGIAPSRFLQEIELSYRLSRDSWANGFATEAARAILREFFQVTEIKNVFSCTHPDNGASRKVLEKLGFVFSHHILSRPIQRDMPVFVIRREFIENSTPASLQEKG